MRKILVSTILGVGIAGTANASIVSSGFLDEKLTEMTNATTLQLDTKANQSDFTELNTQISDSVDNLKSLWDADIGILADGVDPNKFNNDINGAFGLVEGFISHSMLSLTRGWTSSGINVRLENYYNYNPGLEGMFNGWTIYDPNVSETMVYRGLEYISSQFRTVEDAYHISLAKLLLNGDTKVILDDYNYTGPVYPIWKLSKGIDKIGTLPDGITVQAMYEGWTDAKGGIINPGLKGMYDGWTDAGYKFPGLYEIASDTMKFKSAFPNVSIGMLLALGLNEYTYNNYTGPIYPLWKLSEGIDKIDSIETKIGTLPDGYDSVGAALTAIKGIAEDAKAAALAAIPDPKQEGSSGKFVLTVDIVGDNATYHWEKIDREGETTTTTE